MSAMAEFDDDSFDPTRHRVFRVDVTVSYSTYVVAADESDARECAANESREDEASADREYDASEVKRPLMYDGDSIPWGPVSWQGREVRVNEALALIADPPPPGRRTAPIYDTATVLMPFADSPPPIWAGEVSDG